MQKRSLFAAALMVSLAVVRHAHAACTVTFNPGDDVATIVSNTAAGSTFCFNPGVYRMQMIQAKDGDIFTGQTGVILNGSRLLTTFAQETVSGKTYWVATGQTQEGQILGTPPSSFCDATHLLCTRPEDLYIDNKPLLAVGSLSAVVAGSFFFDYPNDKIYFLDTPAGHVLEASVTRSAFPGAINTTGINNLTIQGFIIEKYAIPGNMGAIGDQWPGTGWIVKNNEVRLNHGIGIHAGDHWQVIGNFTHDNGNFGMSASSGRGQFVIQNVLIQGNELSHNNYAGFSTGWGAGGAKFAITNGLVAKCNYVHDNQGPGLWTDINNTNTEYANNLVVNNDGTGIFHEISYNVKIHDNIVKGNGQKDVGWLYGSQILISASGGGEISNNKVEVAAGGVGNGIGLIQQDRTSDWVLAGQGPHNTINNSVHDNHITHLGTVGMDGLAGDYNPLAPANFYAAAGNTFTHNDYHMTSTTQKYWTWNDANLDWTGIRAAGQEATGTMDTHVVPDTTAPGIPSCVATPPPPPTSSKCDQNGDGSTNVADVQGTVNQALGVSACTADINSDGKCNVLDVQRVANAALGGACVVTP